MRLTVLHNGSMQSTSGELELNLNRYNNQHEYSSNVFGNETRKTLDKIISYHFLSNPYYFFIFCVGN